MDRRDRNDLDGRHRFFRNAAFAGTSAAVTDSSGTIGISTGLYYYVSHNRERFRARVQFSAQVGVLPVSNTTGRLITSGGVTSKLVVVSAPVSQTAGLTASFLKSFRFGTPRRLQQSDRPGERERES